MSSINTYEGAKQPAYISKKTKTYYYVTVSNHRPRSCRWEASTQDGAKSIFGATYADMVDEIEEHEATI